MSLLFSGYVKAERRIELLFIVFLVFISEQVMSDSSNSTNCVMRNSDYSSDGVVDKSKDEVAVFVVEFESIFRKFVHNVVSELFQGFFISKQVMSDSSNSTNCVMSNSDYSSDGVVNKSKDEIFFGF